MRILLAAAAVVAAAGLAACGSTISGHPSAGDGRSLVNAATSSARSAPSTSPAKPTTGGHVDFHAEIGDCVTLGGSNAEATIAEAACGSAQSNYKVIGKAPTSGQCATDADNVYYEELRGRETGALCLDRDWVIGGCMDLGGDVTKRIDCGAPAVEGVRVLSILQNTDSVDACPHDDGGFVYEQRKFVVCVQDL
ncbi:LppU family putative lipoprotein [Nocardia blacklockiae]|uniref:LppU family putative lipoprotein n=1 Tax=Nocardia blacklockiae TaxID=480036 RepID=UPI002B4B6806|nr:hypothetical protein [Nocardia blacklockiae]